MIFSLEEPRIGFCCKYVHQDDTLPTKRRQEIEKQYNTGSTTLAWLNRQTKIDAYDALLKLAFQNTQKTFELVKYVGSLPINLRMVRLSSDQLPMYTHRDWSSVYRSPNVVNNLEKEWAKIGDYARENSIRLSFHPGQFCCLASSSPEVVNNSIEELEYHTQLAKWMGFGSNFHDHGFKINIHISGKDGLSGMNAALDRLSPESLNLISIENDEYTYGLSDCISLSKRVAIVLDIHHHWCHSGQYIQNTWDIVKQVEDSWRGIRPILHYSTSRQDYIPNSDPMMLPDMQTLLSLGIKKQKLRAHSDTYWNIAANEWAISFLDRFDIMCEVKTKNLASAELYHTHMKPRK